MLVGRFEPYRISIYIHNVKKKKGGFVIYLDREILERENNANGGCNIQAP